MDPQESFRERVQALVAEGKLTPEEAEQLLGSAVAAPKTPGTSLKTVDVRTDTPVLDTPRRLRVKLQGASVNVYADQTLTSPNVTTQGEGRVELRSTPQGWVLRRESEEGWLNKLMGGLLREALRVDLRVPADFDELEVDVQGGSVRVHDLRSRLRASLQGGSLHATHARALDVNVTGGSLDVSAELDEGAHHVKITGGSANLTVLNAHDVRLTARAVGGSLHASGFNVHTQTANPATTTLHSDQPGKASLDVNITGGSARILGQESTAQQGEVHA